MPMLMPMPTANACAFQRYSLACEAMNNKNGPFRYVKTWTAQFSFIFVIDDICIFSVGPREEVKGRPNERRSEW